MTVFKLGENKMILNMLKSKIHRAVVTQAELNYVGSITIDKALMEAANILENEKVQIVDINNGNRFETYAISGQSNSGVMCLNGAAARCVQPGDKIIVMTYCYMKEEEAKQYKPTVVFVNHNNVIDKITNYESNS
jgi:aspartate 1-decarboxylase